jgi:hypothetical protein
VADISQIVQSARDPRLPEGESFFGFKSIEAARDALDKLKVALSADLNVAYSSGFVRAAAATEYFDPAEFARLGILLRPRGITLARWERTVHDQARPERERITQAKKAAKAAAANRGAPSAPRIELKTVEPWDQPVVGAALLDDVAAFVRRFVRLGSDELIAVVLWIVFTYVFEVAEVSPRLAILSPTQRCGKSTLMRILNLLCWRPLIASNISASAVFRTIDAVHPTMLLDEADSWAPRKSKAGDTGEELRGILNSGHTKDTAFIIRSDKQGDRWEPRKFSTWAPMVCAAIRQLPVTWIDRSIVIRMQRRPKSDAIEKLTRRNLRTVQKQVDELVRKLARWAQDNISYLKDAPAPKIPSSLNDRAEDNWDLLLCIAELAGPDWAKRAYMAAGRVSGDPAEETTDLSFYEQLLSDIRGVFEKRTDERDELHPSTSMVQALATIPDAPWSSMADTKKPITTKRLAKMLDSFGIKPRRKEVARGYAEQDFTAAFEAHLPPLASDDQYTDSAHENQPDDTFVDAPLQKTPFNPSFRQEDEKPLGAVGENRLTDCEIEEDGNAIRQEPVMPKNPLTSDGFKGHDGSADGMTDWEGGMSKGVEENDAKAPPDRGHQNCQYTDTDDRLKVEAEVMRRKMEQGFEDRWDRFPGRIK